MHDLGNDAESSGRTSKLRAAPFELPENEDKPSCVILKTLYLYSGDAAAVRECLRWRKRSGVGYSALLQKGLDRIRTWMRNGGFGGLERVYGVDVNLLVLFC